MHHRGGIDSFTRYAADRLAARGYLVAAPDLYHRCPDTVPLADRKALLKDTEIVADVESAVAQLHARADVARNRIVIMGHCMGGRMALLTTGSMRAFCGAVIFYGGSVAKSWGEGETPFQRLRNITCPVIGFFGNEDRHPSPADVDAIDAELASHGIPHEFHRYPGVGHGFQNPAHDTPLERAAAEDAWTRTFAFLKSVAPGAE
jgi:carboxymethylenebutenolidase